MVRLVDSALENMRALVGIARIRSYYRTLTSDAAVYFAPHHGRWPEESYEPSLRHGRFVAFFTTSASMIASINSIVAGAGITFLAGNLVAGAHTGLALALGIAAAVIVLGAFLAYERSRFRVYEAADSASRAPRENHRLG